MVMMGLERLMTRLKSKVMKMSMKMKNNSYDKIDKSDSMRLEISSRKARKIIQDTLKIADSPNTRSYTF